MVIYRVSNADFIWNLLILFLINLIFYDGLPFKIEIFKFYFVNIKLLWIACILFFYITYRNLIDIDIWTVDFLFKHFGMTPEGISATALELISATS